MGRLWVFAVACIVVSGCAEPTRGKQRPPRAERPPLVEVDRPGDGHDRAPVKLATIRIPVADLFASGRARLSADAERMLQRHVAALRGRTEPVVVCWGDNSPIRTPRFRSSIRLPADRAMTVAEYLIAQGIAAERVSVVGRELDSAAARTAGVVTIELISR